MNEVIIDSIELLDVNNQVVGIFKKPLSVEIPPGVLAFTATGVQKTARLKVQGTTAQLIFGTPEVRVALGLTEEPTEEST